jgi:putative hydrolase of the HAD superfamily
MTKTIIFDLSEVLISGLLGVEKSIAAQVGISEDQVLPVFKTPALQDLFCGKLSEEAYLACLLRDCDWRISPEQIKHLMRENFRRCVPGMEKLVRRLARNYKLVILSDHAREWIAYIQTVHPFLQMFSPCFFSFDLQQTKRYPSTFQRVVRTLNRDPRECLFIDDSLVNIQAAQSIGLPSIQFTSARALVGELVARN